MKIDKQFFLLVLIVLATILIRIPLTPHEILPDTHYINGIAHNIKDMGLVFWNKNPLSFFGLYPFSNEAFGPLFLAIASHITQLDMEALILISSIIFAIVGLFGIKILTKNVSNNDPFVFLSIILFAFSPLFIKFTSWSFSTRGLFMAISPWFIYFLLSSAKNNDPQRYKAIALSIILLFVLFATHKLTFLLLPIVAIILINNLTQLVSRNTLIRLTLLIFAVFLLYLQLNNFSLDFLIERFGNDLPINISAKNLFNITLFMLTYFAARLGFVLPLLLLGISYFTFKKQISKNEALFLLCSLVFLSIIFTSEYVYQAGLPFFSVLSALFICDIIKKINHLAFKKITLFLFIVGYLTFSMITILHRVDENDNFMTERDYALGEYLKKSEDGYLSATIIPSSTTFPFFDASKVYSEGVFSSLYFSEKEVSFRPIKFKSIRDLQEFLRLPFTLKGMKYPVSPYNEKYVHLRERTKKFIDTSSGEKKYLTIDNDNKIYDNGRNAFWHLN